MSTNQPEIAPVVAQLYKAITGAKAKRVMKIVSPKLTVKLTQQKHPSRSKDQQVYLLTVGKPKTADAMRIATMKKAGRLFPVKDIETKPWPEVPRALRASPAAAARKTRKPRAVVRKARAKSTARKAVAK